MSKNVYIVKKVSRKEGKTEFPYLQMYVDLGYRRTVLSMDAGTISELSDLPMSTLYDFEENTPVKVAEYNLKGE